jgi:hypothetical protein
MYAAAIERRLSILALIASMLMLSACATTAPSQSETSSPVGKIDVSSIIAAMAHRDRALESLQTSAVMEYTNGTDHVKAREGIVVRRPDGLRVEAMSPFGVALIVAARDSRLQIFEPSKNTLMRGTADAATLARFARIPMAPRDAVGLLMGIVPEAQTTSAPDSITSEGDMTVLAYAEADHSRRELGFQDNQLVMVRKRTTAGAIDFEIRYADYHDIGGVMFAYKVDADFPSAQTRVSFVYKRPIVNGKIADSVFTLTPGPDAKQVDLGMRPSRRNPLDG